MQRLARERLVQILPRRGVIVSDININSQLRLLELRREVERLLARSAARRATPEHRARFEELASQFEKSARRNDDIAFMRVDRAFNELCLAAARNEFTVSAMGLTQSLSRRFWYHHYKQAPDMPETAKLHADIARAIAAGRRGRRRRGDRSPDRQDRRLHPRHDQHRFLRRAMAGARARRRAPSART